MRTTNTASRSAVSVDVTVLRRTAQALLVSDSEGTGGWVPRSQVEEDEVGGIAGAQCVLTMPAWLAEGKGFVGEVCS